MNWKQKLVYLASLVMVLVCGGLTGSVTASANTPYQSVVATNQNQNDNNSNNSNNDNDGNDHSGGYVPDGGGHGGGYVPGGDGTAGGSVTPGSTTTGATAGATASDGVGAGTVAANSKDPDSYGVVSKKLPKSANPTNNDNSSLPNSPDVSTSGATSGNYYDKDKSGAIRSVDDKNSKNESSRFNTNTNSLDMYRNNNLHPRSTLARKGHSRHKRISYKTTYNGKSLDKYQRRELSYEKKYYRHYNKKYPDFNAGGGDCTNYASQIAVRGGKRMTKRGKEVSGKNWYDSQTTNPRKWYCRHKRMSPYMTPVGPLKAGYKYEYSTSWSTVPGLWNYWTKVKGKKHFTTSSVRRVAAHVRVGDIIEFMFKGKKREWEHTVTVSKVTKHMVYYTSHLTNALYRPLSYTTKSHGYHAVAKYRVIQMGV